MNAQPKEKIFIVDGSGYIFRAFYAVPPLTTKEGFPTNALLGFTRMILRLLKEADSQHLVVVFDAGRETFRNQLYPQYKANRTECPEDLAVQMPYFREIIRALGIVVLEQKGFEADDIIATISTRLEQSGHPIVIVTADKDLMQLVGSQVSLWDTMRDRRVSFAEVKEKFGVAPDKVVEVLGLIGDSSDNIPGVKGIGEKTAAQLIDLYGDVEAVIGAVEQIKEQSLIRNRKKIAEQIELETELLRLSRKLVEVVRDVPVEFSGSTPPQPSSLPSNSLRLIQEMNDSELIVAMERGTPQHDLLGNLIEKFAFQSLEKDLGVALKPRAKQSHQFVYKSVLAEQFSSWFEELKVQKSFSIDLETTGLDPLSAQIVGLSFCWSQSEAWYVPVGHTTIPTGQMKWPELKELLRPILEDSSITKVGQNLKFDSQMLAAHGVLLAGIAFDTMIAAYLLNPDRRNFTLSSLALDYLGLSVSEYSEVTAGLESFADVTLEQATNYAAEDAHIAWLLKNIFTPLIDEAHLGTVFYEIEVPLVAVLAQMERRGILLDSQLLSKLSLEYDEKLKILQEQLYQLAGCEFNLNSPKQLSEVLFEKLQIPTKGLKKTKTGISTDSSVLEQIADQHPLARQILEYRMLHKLKSTYVDALPAQVSTVSGRLHTRFNQTGTGTGRLSSSDPNLQNIPIQSVEGRRVREAFIAKPGYQLLSADYSQIELRLLAHLSADEALCQAFVEDKDIHEITTREILSIPPLLPVTKEQRRMGKTINFGIIYGMSAFRLAKELEIPVGVAQKYIDNYFARYAKVKKYFSSLTDDAEKLGFVTTITGRQRKISDLDIGGRDRGFLQRVAINAPIQGSAADLIKMAMVAIDRRITKEKLALDMLLQIHDELVFECREDFIAEGTQIVREVMEGVMALKVPLLVDIGSGLNWELAHG
jgi:DNA polymerase I